MSAKVKGILFISVFLILNWGVIHYRQTNVLYMGEDYSSCSCREYGLLEVYDFQESKVLDSMFFLKQKEKEEFYAIAERLPLFPGCEKEHSIREQHSCSDQKAKEFIYSNIKYPTVSDKPAKEGMVVVQARVMKDGTFCNIRIARGLGEPFDGEAIRVVRMMNQLNYKWTSGKQQGKPVNIVKYIPILFKPNL